MFNWPRLRALVLRVFGLLVFAVAALAAFGLVTYGVAGSQSWFVDAAESFATWVSAPLSSGTAVLVGVGLLVLAAFLAVVMVPRRPRTLPIIREGESGTTLLDLVSVAEAVEHRLRLGGRFRHRGGSQERPSEGRDSVRPEPAVRGGR